MICLFSGTPGSGKSLHVAEIIYNNLKHPPRRTIICNFEINMNCLLSKRQIRNGVQVPFYYINNEDLNPDTLIEMARDHFKGKKVKEEDIILIIDECQLIFNARDWNKPDRKGWLSFFTQHRKYGYRVILVAQFDNMLDKQIRSLIEYEFIHRKMSNFGIRGKILSLLFGGNTFVAVKVWYPLKEKVGATLFHAKRKYYRIYDTFLDFSSNT